jgi:COP9 signalosome complex subunit 6
LESHLQTQRSAVKMLHERILVLVKYVADVIAGFCLLFLFYFMPKWQRIKGQATKNHDILRSLAALIASLPASENKAFREEFETEYEDVQLTAFLSSLTKSANILNDLVDKHLVTTTGRDDRGPRRRMGRQGTIPGGDWGDRLH